MFNVLKLSEVKMVLFVKAEAMKHGIESLGPISDLDVLLTYCL